MGALRRSPLPDKMEEPQESWGRGASLGVREGLGMFPEAAVSQGQAPGPRGQGCRGGTLACGRDGQSRVQSASGLEGQEIKEGLQCRQRSSAGSRSGASSRGALVGSQGVRPNCLAVSTQVRVGPRNGVHVRDSSCEGRLGPPNSRLGHGSHLPSPSQGLSPASFISVHLAAEKIPK